MYIDVQEAHVWMGLLSLGVEPRAASYENVYLWQVAQVEYDHAAGVYYIKTMWSSGAEKLRGRCLHTLNDVRDVIRPKKKKKKKKSTKVITQGDKEMSNVYGMRS
jgi:hypothetical protein